MQYSGGRPYQMVRVPAQSGAARTDTSLGVAGSHLMLQRRLLLRWQRKALRGARLRLMHPK